jgi:hypothetical protein
MVTSTHMSGATGTTGSVGHHYEMSDLAVAVIDGKTLLLPIELGVPRFAVGPARHREGQRASVKVAHTPGEAVTSQGLDDVHRQVGSVVRLLRRGVLLLLCVAGLELLAFISGPTSTTSALSAIASGRSLVLAGGRIADLRELAAHAIVPPTWWEHRGVAAAFAISGVGLIAVGIRALVILLFGR